MGKILDSKNPLDTKHFDEIRYMANPKGLWRDSLRIPHKYRNAWYDFFMKIAWWGYNVGIKVRK